MHLRWGIHVRVHKERRQVDEDERCEPVIFQKRILLRCGERGGSAVHAAK